MARPEIAFSLEHDGRRILSLQAGEAMADRVAGIVARELKDNAVGIDLERGDMRLAGIAGLPTYTRGVRSEEHTSELQSLMSLSYAVFCLKRKIHVICQTQAIPDRNRT